MNEAIIGIVVGVAVALIGQIISYVSDRLKINREEHWQAKAVIALLRNEVECHKGIYEHHILWADESIKKGGPEHTGYSYEKVETDAYDKVFLTKWYLLPDEVTKPVMRYYSSVRTFNILSGDFGIPTPVPIIQAKDAMERTRAGADELIKLLEKHQ